MRRFGWTTLVVLVACSSGGSGAGSKASTIPLMAGFQPGVAPASGTGFQVILPIVTDIAAGGSYEYCTWTDVTLDQDVWVKKSQGVQSDTGHHAIVFYTLNSQPAGQSRICSDSDMASFRFAISGTGEGVDQSNELPGVLAVDFALGAQIVINHHYLNATAQDVAQAQSSVNVYYAAPGTQPTLASSVAFVDTSMNVAPGTNSTDFTCTVKDTFATWYFIPHMHNWGTHITVEHVSGTNTKRLFDLDWDPSYAFHPSDHDGGSDDTLHVERGRPNSRPLRLRQHDKRRALLWPRDVRCVRPNRRHGRSREPRLRLGALGPILRGAPAHRPRNRAMGRLTLLPGK